MTDPMLNPNGHTHDTAWILPAHDGMDDTSTDRRSSDPSIPSVPSDLKHLIVPKDLRAIMEGLTEIIRQTLGVDNEISTSDIDAPIDHGLLRAVLIELHAQNMNLPDDVGVVISAIQAYLHSGSIDHTNPLVR